MREAIESWGYRFPFCSGRNARGKPCGNPISVIGEPTVETADGQRFCRYHVPRDAQIVSIWGSVTAIPLTSKYSGRCRGCHEPYSVGDPIVWTRPEGFGTWHPDCFNARRSMTDGNGDRVYDETSGART